MWDSPARNSSRRSLKRRTTPKNCKADGKLECRYHLIGKHGGVWIYNVKSNEELDLLLAMAPVYNFAHYEVLPLADMSDPATIVGQSR